MFLRSTRSLFNDANAAKRFVQKFREDGGQCA